MDMKNCTYCEQKPAECICKAVARFFANAPGAPATPAVAPKPIAMRSLQRLAAMLVVGLVAASATACGGAPQETPLHATPYVSTDYANQRCDVLQGPYGVEIMCPNGGYGFVKYREPGTLPAYMGLYNPWPAKR